MIQRRKEYGKREPSRDAHIIYIVCEGKGTEPAYFSFFEGLSSNLQVITIPPTDGTDPLKLMERAKQILIGEGRTYTVEYQHGDTVWFVIDTDTWEEEGKIAPLREFCVKQNEAIPQKLDEVKTYNAWNVAQSNPSFEIWLYYHIYDSKPTDEEVEKAHSFKEYVNSKISGGFDFQSHPVFLEDAIKNSENHFSKDDDGLIEKYATEMHILGHDILGFTKQELDKLKNKIG
jgi:hypothetical protein